MTVLFITHDLNIVHRICSWVAVIYLGEIVEMGTVDEVYCSPAHPYTTLLLESIVDGDPNTKEKSVVDIGETSQRALPGCPFYSRCPRRLIECAKTRPERRMLLGTHSVKCYLYDVCKPEPPEKGDNQ